MYEHISILKGSLSKEEIDEEIKKFIEYFKEHNIEVKTFENMGLRKLAYEINKNKEGNYTRYEFLANELDIPDFERFTRKNENVIKFITIRTEKEITNNIILEEIEELDESNLYKAIAEDVVVHLQNKIDDARNIEFDLDDVMDITESILDDDYFSECMSNAISYAIEKKYPEQENEEESEEEL
jgi:small subunit ribosomal protein S6